MTTVTKMFEAAGREIAPAEIDMSGTAEDYRPMSKVVMSGGVQVTVYKTRNIKGSTAKVLVIGEKVLRFPARYECYVINDSGKAIDLKIFGNARPDKEVVQKFITG